MLLSAPFYTENCQFSFSTNAFVNCGYF